MCLTEESPRQPPSGAREAVGTAEAANAGGEALVGRAVRPEEEGRRRRSFDC